MGELEVAWLAEFEAELARREIFVQAGSAAFNHFSLFPALPGVRGMADNSMKIIAGSQSLADR